ncbi:MAG: UDP-N-acetyl glucosamine 2-epimerase [Desulfobacteraceae bacterium]|nr:UDP-N-acetyl glucosamine 2-epimerase [Desulfobacteraceae bacterium]
MYKIHLIAAARPNFMKIAPLYHALIKEDWADTVIVHTGQHYDLNMSDVFFKDLGLPDPHIHLGVGGGSHAEQCGKVMMAYEKVLDEYRPDMVVVVGDVNATMACTLAASKIQYAPTSSNDNNMAHSGSYELSAMSYRLGQCPLVAHLEAGLRSFDRTMPEEINRIVTDSLADLLWTPSPDADENLIREGIASEKIRRVGNIMIDSLEMMRSRIEEDATFQRLGLSGRRYGLLTLHRPSNVDDPEILGNLCRALARISEKLPLVFPVHPRTTKNLERFGLADNLHRKPSIHLLEPLNYISFMNLVFHASLVITDSGGVQEETTYLGIPCLTLRPNTERPITIEQGTNRLCTPSNLEDRFETVFTKKYQKGKVPDMWDGHTAIRVVDSLKGF